MIIAAGQQFAEKIHQKAKAICPALDWIPFSPDKPWHPGDCEAAVLIGDAYTPEFKTSLPAMRSLRWVHTKNSGIDSLFYHELINRGITLTRSPGANAPETAEFIFALMLNKIKRIDMLTEQQRECRWERLPLGALNGQTLLIVGLGEIGSRVARIAEAFAMYVLGIRRSAELLAGVAEQGTVCDLQFFIPRADIIVLATPLTSETLHLLGEKELAVIKDGSLLINVSRGDVIDTAALRRCLSERPSITACLDVMPEEPWPSDDELWHYKNVFLTPHIAWSSPNYRVRAGEMWLENLRRFVKGQPLLHVVNR